MSLAALPASSESDLRRRLRRPAGITEGARWLYCLLGVVSILLSLPPVMVTGGNSARVLAVVAAIILIASCIRGYLIGRMPLIRDVMDAVAVGAFALACPNPALIIPIAFSGLWFRALYGSTVQSLRRCAVYSIAVAIAVPMWPLIHGSASAPVSVRMLGAIPFAVLTAVVAGQLGSSLRLREQSLHRDSILAVAGSRLLGITDAGVIRSMAWNAAVEICSATPGLRMVMATRDGDVLRVAGATGGFETVPATLPIGVVTTGPSWEGAVVAEPPSLDAAVGTVLSWIYVGLNEHRADSWLLAGMPKVLPSEVVIAVHSLANQLALALRNSDVHEELTTQARVDSLTGLANRAAFTAGLAARLEQTARNRRDASLHVMFIDLDDFKDVNDVLGHNAGDQLLVDVAGRLRKATRTEDLCARLGGDEFAVVVRGLDDVAAAEIGQRIVDSIAQPVLLGGRSARVGASIGIAAGVPGIDIEELVHQADVAMYAAKAHGKGQVLLFDPALLQADSSRLIFERELAAATAAGELVMHYQPILSSPDLRCGAVEGLVRWRHPVRGLLGPEDFLETAERTGSIIDIGTFALRRACTDAAMWRDSYPDRPPAVHINLSARQLDHDRFIETVVGCLAEAQLPASQLVLELTETLVINSPSAIERLRTLAAHGVKIAIDDFGTGYSSLTTLRTVPLAVVKLDWSFTAGAVTNPVDRTVIKSIVQMSRQLGLHTVAEGVERLEQQQFLEEIGIDALQGYLYSRPIPADQLTAWLAKNLGLRVVRLTA